MTTLSTNAARGSGRSSGFTLIELMVTVSILALLAGIAIPTYRHYVLRANRSEAQMLLRDAATQQERYLAQYSKYTDDPAKLAFTYPLATGGKRLSPHQLYALEAQYIDDNVRSYRLTAVRMGAQQRDIECGDFTLDYQGTRGISNGGVENCWR